MRNMNIPISVTKSDCIEIETSLRGELENRRVSPLWHQSIELDTAESEYAIENRIDAIDRVLEIIADARGERFNNFASGYEPPFA